MVTEVANGARYLSSGPEVRTTQSISGMAGKTVLITVDVYSITDGSITIGTAAGGNDVVSGSTITGVSYYTVTALTDTISIKRGNGAGDDFVIRSISVREVITAGNEFKRLSYADCLAIVPYEAGVVPKWAKLGGVCLLKEAATWPNNQIWTDDEVAQTENWRTELTDECGEDPA
jgi:hypothetical protein